MNIPVISLWPLTGTVSMLENYSHYISAYDVYATISVHYGLPKHSAVVRDVLPYSVAQRIVAEYLDSKKQQGTFDSFVNRFISEVIHGSDIDVRLCNYKMALVEYNALDRSVGNRYSNDTD